MPESEKALEDAERAARNHLLFHLAIAILFSICLLTSNTTYTCLPPSPTFRTAATLRLIMALNWTMTNADGSPIPLPQEMTICTIDSGAELKLSVPADARGAAAKTFQSAGRVYLTDKRVRVLRLRVRSRSLTRHIAHPAHLHQPLRHTQAPLRLALCTPTLRALDKVRAADVRVELSEAHDQACAGWRADRGHGG